MDRTNRAAVSNALDVAIATVARRDISRLSLGLSTDAIAKKIFAALHDLRGLKNGIAPNYTDEWVAILYSLWYQPSQVNLAYTLTQQVPEDKNPLLANTASLSVLDFGCGLSAMQFGLAFAMIDKYQTRNSCPKITIYRYDESDSMRSIGLRIWDEFMREIYKSNGRIHELLETRLRPEDLDRRDLLNMDLIDAHDLPRNVEFRRHDTYSIQDHIRWLTVLHVAYEKNCQSTRKELNDCVFYYSPDMVLVTSHPKADQYRFFPKPIYKCYPYYIADPLPANERIGYNCCYENRGLQKGLNMKGELHEINKLRLGLYNRMSGTSVGDGDPTVKWLKMPVWWSGKTSLAGSIYAKNERSR